ncbi:hypothetical protein VCR4J5_200086 [Vibrio crassostreae]|uniref:Uncharacterized protein n=1 Tax=Vibrio crassostreae TaxID=246167 RepID=A0A822MYM2_9VIBR|nr:hypothetical protein VCR20J5_1240417 [Vibrio crassostreae]CDT32903.1 hypothetical protein VCR4J5_200086 [Vibrio crassostreae]CDT49035.1 hypothetical protein VCR19J5_560086 [Vibrio crassostreae]CDT58173.1 hypothetical protein VCR5J5_720025 [Vibrio crassostreae]
MNECSVCCSLIRKMGIQLYWMRLINDIWNDDEQETSTRYYF